jgi:hypothetical protein
MLKAAGLLLSFFSLAFWTGCTAHVGYKAYDPVHSDYHVWSPGESTYYNQWAVETHRPRRDYRRLRREDQREYWRWRHDHPDHR